MSSRGFDPETIHALAGNGLVYITPADALERFVGNYPEDIEHRPQKSTKKSKEIEKCAVCFEEMGKPCECTKLPCGHTFHTNCISQLRDSSIDNKCPLCRANLPPGTLEEEVYEEKRKHYKHNKKVYTGSHCVVLHSQIIYKQSGNESNIWCTYQWEYCGAVKVKTKHKNPIPKSRKSNKKYKNFKNRV